MRFLYFTDTHIRGSNPKSRKDNFLESLIAKIDELVTLSRQLQVDYVLHGGDLFDRPDVSISVMNAVIPSLRAFQKPIYIISGNHDIYGHNPKTLPRTMLGLLGNLELVHILNDKSVLLEKDGVVVQLSGSPYRYGQEEKHHRDGYFVKKRDPSAQYAIHLVHGFLMDRKFLDQIPHTLISEITDTLADLTISGHYHYGFKTQTIDGKFFANPGALVRISNSLNEMKRIPKALLIDATKEELLVKNLYLQSVKPGEEVLDREEIEKHRFKRLEIEEFKEIIATSSDLKKLNLTDIVMEIAKSEGISQEVRTATLDRIAEAQMNEAKLK